METNLGTCSTGDQVLSPEIEWCCTQQGFCWKSWIITLLQRSHCHHYVETITTTGHYVHLCSVIATSQHSEPHFLSPVAGVPPEVHRSYGRRHESEARPSWSPELTRDLWPKIYHPISLGILVKCWPIPFEDMFETQIPNQICDPSTKSSRGSNSAAPNFFALHLMKFEWLSSGILRP